MKSLSKQERSSVDRWLPVGLFAVFLTATVTVTIFFAPSWGLMDDFGLLKMAREFKSNPWNVGIVTENFITSGMLRPFYYSWAAIFYGWFEHWPTGFYLFVALWNFTAMVFWGMVFSKMFIMRPEDRNWAVFFYPLTFFIFTPFWNIFNYLSLQEKFVVFFAPLVFLFFHRLYRDFKKSDLLLLYVFLFCGLMSKATFVYVPFVLFVYALLDLIIWRFRPQVSWVLVWINGIIFAAYAVFTLTFQIHGNYTAKYKEGLAGGAFLGKIIGLSVLFKLLLFIGAIGLLGTIVYAKFKKKPEVSFASMIFLALMTYIVLLLPWGSQSYLVSAIAPLAMGSLFPFYAWLLSRGLVVKWTAHIALVVLLCFIFTGNIIPNIRRMGEIGQTVAFIRGQSNMNEQRYFIPPPYVESGDAMKKFTQKDVVFRGDGELSGDMLLEGPGNYLVTNELFSPIHLSGVRISDEVYSNVSWKVFRIVPQKDHDETFKVDFPRTWVQKFKAKVREL